jgi:hypothetical protein
MKGLVMSIVRKALATAAVTGMLVTGGMAAPAYAQQEGLVNVNIRDVTILENVNVGVAAQIVAAICGVGINAAVLAVQEVDDTGVADTCTARGGRGGVTVSQDAG